MEYTEHEKLKKIADKSQTVGEFLEWLQGEKGVTLAEYNRNDNLYPVRFSIQDLLAEFFEIDQNRLETEKQHMLEELRNMHTQEG